MDFYIGKPYSFRRFNCWDYAKLIRSDNGIVTKMFQPKTLSGAFELITAEMSKLGHGLSLVIEPENFDIIFVENEINGKKRYHCGVYHDNHVAHCCPLFGSVRYELLSDFKSGYSGVSFWR